MTSFLPTPATLSPARRLLIAIALVALCLAWTGCSPGDPDAAAWRDAGLPEWLPPYPGTTPELLSQGTSGGDLVGLVAISMTQDPKASGKLYKELLLAAGFKVRLFPTDTPGGRTWRLEADSEDDTRGVYVTISPNDAGSNFTLNYSEAR